MTREDLIFNVARTLSKEMDEAKFHMPADIAEEAARIVLSAIEQSGCTICPNEPTDEMRIAGAFQIHRDPILQDHMKAQSCFEAMLSSSPFNTQGEAE